MKGTGEDEDRAEINPDPEQTQYCLVTLTENAINQDFWLLCGIIWQPTGKDAQF